MFEILIVIHSAFIISTSSTFNCKIPSGCKIGNVHLPFSAFGYEKTSIEVDDLLCEIRDEQFQFNFPMPWPLLRPIDKEGPKFKDKCTINEHLRLRDAIEFRFHSNFVLNKHFNITNLFSYLSYFRDYTMPIFVNLNGFELDILNDSNQNLSIISKAKINLVYCIKCRMDFIQMVVNLKHVKILLIPIQIIILLGFGQYFKFIVRTSKNSKWYCWMLNSKQ